MTNVVSNTENDNGSYAHKTLTGALYMTSLRWVVRLIGLVSISITARILTPEDFGIHSSAAMALGFFMVLRSVGVSEFLIKEKTIDSDAINTSWTIGLISAGIVTTLLVILSPFAPSILKDERVTLVLLIIAFVPLVDALNSPQMMLLMREFRFSEMFRIRVAEKMIYFIAQVGLIYAFQQYWAIAAGSLVASISFTIYTHLAFKTRPSFTFTKVRAVGSFAGYALLRGVAGFLAGMADSLAARQMVVSSEFGGYHNTKDLARNLVYEAASPIAAVMLPTLSRLRDETDRFIRATANSYGVMLYWVGFTVVSFYLLGESVVRLLLGEQWLFSVLYLKISTFVVGFNALEQFLAKTLISLDRQPLLTAITLVKSIMAIAAALVLVGYDDLTLLLYGALLVWATINIVLIGAISVSLKAGLKLVAVHIRPTLTVTTTYLVMHYININIQDFELHFVLSAIIIAVLTTVIFVVIACSLWLLGGKPNGPELAAWALFGERLATLRQRISPK